MKTMCFKSCFRIALFLIAITSILLSSAVRAQEHVMDTSERSHVMLLPGEMKWSDGPASLPPGAKFVVIEGDPAKAGLFTMRASLPANYTIQAHWHPAFEHVTVISGTFMMGLGDKFDGKKLKALSAGGFAVMPPKTTHFAMTKVETVIQLHGMGPWAINYVNPADDPRKKQ